MKVKFDLDGVLRSLIDYLVNKYKMPYPETWGWLFKEMNIFKLVKDEGFQALVYSPVTEYISILKSMKDIEVWTCQPRNWRLYTEMWIREYIGDCKIRYLTTEQKRAALDKEPETYLVEDCPNFKSYDRIILIDRPYNQKVECEFRVKTLEELKGIIEKLK